MFSCNVFSNSYGFHVNFFNEVLGRLLLICIVQAIGMDGKRGICPRFFRLFQVFSIEMNCITWIVAIFISALPRINTHPMAKKVDKRTASNKSPLVSDSILGALAKTFFLTSVRFWKYWGGGAFSTVPDSCSFDLSVGLIILLYPSLRDVGHHNADYPCISFNYAINEVLIYGNFLWHLHFTEICRSHLLTEGSICNTPCFCSNKTCLNLQYPLLLWQDTMFKNILCNTPCSCDMYSNQACRLGVRGGKKGPPDGF